MALDPSALDNILETVKSGIGIQPSDTTFDGPLTNHINGALQIVNQMGLGDSTVRVSVDGSELWSQFLPDGNDELYALAKSYVILKVQSMFDPPTSGIVTGAMEKLLDEAASRLIYEIESQTI